MLSHQCYCDIMQEISREMQVCASNGKQCYLVDVIAQILKHLKLTFIEDHLQPSGHSFQASDFDWVITVPAIWRAKGKQIMREAGYKVSIKLSVSVDERGPQKGGRVSSLSSIRSTAVMHCKTNQIAWP